MGKCWSKLNKTKPRVIEDQVKLPVNTPVWRLADISGAVARLATMESMVLHQCFHSAQWELLCTKYPEPLDLFYFNQD